MASLAFPSFFAPETPAAVRQQTGNRVLPARWCYQALTGRLSEISGIGATATLTLACALTLDAQHQREPVAWILRTTSTFFPPDVVDSGIDLEALVVVRVPDAAAAARAADMLTRSGAFGVIVLDLGAEAHVPLALQARLVGLARHHDTMILCLTEKRAGMPSLSSLVSLRGEVRRHQTSPDQFTCMLTAMKDKRCGPGWIYADEYVAPLGLR